MSTSPTNPWNNALTQGAPRVMLSDIEFPALGKQRIIPETLPPPHLELTNSRAHPGSAIETATRRRSASPAAQMVPPQSSTEGASVDAPSGTGVDTTNSCATPAAAVTGVDRLVEGDQEVTATRGDESASGSTELQGVAASMHAPHNRQPSPPLLEGASREGILTIGQSPVTTLSPSHNRFEALADLSPSTVEEMVRMPSQNAKGKRRAQKRRRTASFSSSSADEDSQPASAHATAPATPVVNRRHARTSEQHRRATPASNVALRKIIRTQHEIYADIENQHPQSSAEVPRHLSTLFAWMTDSEAEELRQTTGYSIEHTGRTATRNNGSHELSVGSASLADISNLSSTHEAPARRGNSSFQEPLQQLNTHTMYYTTPASATLSVSSTVPPLLLEGTSTVTQTLDATEEQPSAPPPSPATAALSHQADTRVEEENEVVPMDEDLDDDTEDPLYAGDTEPHREHLSLIPFTRPSEHHEVPMVNHPEGWFDNANGVQTMAWRARDDALLVRVGGSGYLTQHSARRQTADLAVQLIREAYGPQPSLRISIPSPHYAVNGTNQPPYSYLIWGLDAQLRNTLLEARYITTDRGALFFTSNQPEIPRLVTSIAHFEDADEAELRQHFQDALTARGLDHYLYSIIPTHPELALLPVDEAVARVRASMSLEVVRARGTGGADLLVAHLFMDPPTMDPATWTAFRDVVESTSFAHPLLGMDMAVFNEWRCRFCHSCTHPSGMCHLLTEPGWILPAAFQNSNTAAAAAPAPPPPPPAPAPPVLPANAVYTTVAAPQTYRGGNARGRARGRGNGRGFGRGRNH
ncbi:hypothetical protein BDY19DRAFT_990686 [Irpex rosettiformis]|uniref:Uncharacterized protein n=1 Tax=Irpex rosettiformis TaxID=378272 RepID=A0ACB8UC06_9APHY|nr:hypothetical protein BDY19DRAFT_990686 [Irpex rosettiformis]